MLTDLDCLSSLPAVKAVKSGRIIYADEFKRRLVHVTDVLREMGVDA